MGIAENIDIVATARSLGFELSRSGNNKYFSKCFYHDEKTPSLCFNADKNFYYCFSCNTGGDSIRLVQDKLKCDFSEACEYLENLWGIKLQSKKSNAKDYEILENVNLSYQNAFESSVAKEYAKSRFLNDESIKNFELGYGGCKDGDFAMFNNRLILPIRNHSGKLCGFGARLLEKSKHMKYINSKNSNIFNKSNILYGLHLAKEHIKKQDEAIIVEGYFDVILAHQNGLKNAVAPLGVALNDFHIKQLSTYSQNITLCFDNDEAGAKATLKVIKLLINSLERLRVMKLPDGFKDFGEYLVAKNPSKYEKVNALFFACEYLLKDFEIDDKSKNQMKINNVNALFSNVPSVYLKECVKDELLKKYSFLKGAYFQILPQKSVAKAVKIYKSNKSEIEATLIYLMSEKNSNLEYVKSMINPLMMKDYKNEFESVLNGKELDKTSFYEILAVADKKIDIELVVGLKLREYVSDKLSLLNERLKANVNVVLENKEMLIKRIIYYQDYLKQLRARFNFT